MYCVANYPCLPAINRGLSTWLIIVFINLLVQWQMDKDLFEVGGELNRKGLCVLDFG